MIFISKFGMSVVQVCILYLNFYGIVWLIAFGCGHSLACCPQLNTFEMAMHAYRHLANETDGQTDYTIAL